MFQQVRQIQISTKTAQFLLIVCCACLLSACGGPPASFNKEEWTIDYNNCFPCVLYEAAFGAIENTLGTLLQITTQMGLTLLGLGLLFWLAFKVASLFSLKDPNIKDFILQVAGALFKAIIVAALIYDSDRYLNFIGYYIVQPIFMFFADISRSILLSNDVVAQNLITPQDITGIETTPAMSGLFGEAKSYLLDIIYRIFAGLYMGIGLALTILQQVGFVSLIFGLAILVAFFILLVIFPLIFVDAFIQVCSILILSPFAFVAWVFPPTKKIIGKIWNIIFGAMINILFGCIYIALMTYVLLVFSERTFPGILGTARQTMDPTLEMHVKTASTDFLGFFILIVALALLAGVIPKLAQKLSGTQVQSGGVISTLIQAVNTTKNAGKAAKNLAGDAIGVTKATGKAVAATAKSVSAILKKFQKK